MGLVKPMLSKFSANIHNPKQYPSNSDSHSFSLLAHFVPLSSWVFNIIHMTDIDFIRLSALVFATKLIGKTTDPIREGTEMAERLFNKLKEKED